MAEENNEQGGTGALDLSALGSFDFTPAWAKGKPNDPAKYARFEAQEERREGGERPRRDDRGPRREDRPPRTFTKPLDVDVRILPGQKQLGEFIRKIQSQPFMAYPLKQLAYFFV